MLLIYVVDWIAGCVFTTDVVDAEISALTLRTTFICVSLSSMSLDAILSWHILLLVVLMRFMWQLLFLSVFPIVLLPKLLEY